MQLITVSMKQDSYLSHLAPNSGEDRSVLRLYHKSYGVLFFFRTVHFSATAKVLKKSFGAGLASVTVFGLCESLIPAQSNKQSKRFSDGLHAASNDVLISHTG